MHDTTTARPPPSPSSPAAVEAASAMRLRFQWDSLRRGDWLLVQDAGSPDRGLGPAVVASAGGHHDVAVRHPDGPDPLCDAGDCWRCVESLAA